MKRKDKKYNKEAKVALPADLTSINIDYRVEGYKCPKVYDKMTITSYYTYAIKKCRLLIREITISPEADPDHPEYFIIYPRAFANCCYLEKITFKVDNLVVGEFAFSHCRNLKEVVFEGSVDGICNSAFEGCINLKMVIFKDKCGPIGVNVFKGCENIEYANIPASIKDNLLYAFTGKCNWRNYFVDLGLPSNTIWTRHRAERRQNKNGFFSFWPTINHLKELLDYCTKEEYDGYAIYRSNINGETIKITDEEWEDAYQNCLYLYDWDWD